MSEAPVETVVTATPRLFIRLWRPDEVEALHAILGDPLTMHAWPEPYDLERVRRWIAGGDEEFARRGTGRWALERKADGALIGDAGLVPSTAAGRAATAGR